MFLRQRIPIDGTADVQLDTSGHDYALLFTVTGAGGSCDYWIVSQDRSEYETGSGTVAAGGVMARTAVSSSSNGGARVNFGAGSHAVHVEST